VNKLLLLLAELLHALSLSLSLSHINDDALFLLFF